MNEQDGMSRTALHLASWKGDADLVQLLLGAKASTLAKARDNFSALHFASQSGSLECCQLLVASNPKLLHESISKGKKKPLHLAAAKNNFDICQFLLSAGADPTALTSSKQTALDFSKDEKVFQLIKSSIAAKIDESGAAAGKRKMEQDEPEEEEEEKEDKQEDTDVTTLNAITQGATLTATTASTASSGKVVTGNEEGEGGQHQQGQGTSSNLTTAPVVRKTKKQKMNKKTLTKLSCYDDEGDGDTAEEY